MDGALPGKNKKFRALTVTGPIQDMMLFPELSGRENKIEGKSSVNGFPPLPLQMYKLMFP